jgi:hypothetical protein
MDVVGWVGSKSAMRPRCREVWRVFIFLYAELTADSKRDKYDRNRSIQQGDETVPN